LDLLIAQWNANQRRAVAGKLAGRQPLGTLPALRSAKVLEIRAFPRQDSPSGLRHPFQQVSCSPIEKPIE